MNGKEFENIVLDRLRKDRERGLCSVGRYGVQASLRQDYKVRDCPHCGKQHMPPDKTFVWQPQDSYPDIEGVLPPLGRQFVFEAKVCGEASFGLQDSHFSERQLLHLLERDEFGAICFVLIHFTERRLKARTDPPETWAFPISKRHQFWQAVDRLEIKRITREAAREYGVAVEWNTVPGGRTERPDVLNAIHDLAKLKDVGWQPLAKHEFKFQESP